MTTNQREIVKDIVGTARYFLDSNSDCRALIQGDSKDNPSDILDKLQTSNITYFNGRQFFGGQDPGETNYAAARGSQELIRRGKDAVEPLLGALENDTRLTRSVRSSRPWHYDRHFMTVYESALQAVRRILSIGNKDFEDWETIEKGVEGRRAVAARLRKLAQL